MDCCHATPGDGIETLDWFHYHLTEEGKLALETLHLPHVHFAKILDGHEQAFSKRDFFLLSTHLLQTAERYERDFTLCRIDARNLDAQRESLGRRAAHALFSKLVDLIQETIRETDIVTSNGDIILIAAPETSVTAAHTMLRRLEGAVRKTLSPAPDLVHEVAQGDDARAILDTLA
jgi:GGDEF domain-containing protein